MMTLDDKETTLPGVVITFVLTAFLWVGLFSLGWFMGKSITGSEIGGAAGVIFCVLAAKDIYFKVWTK